ncbi:MAG: DUF1800 family protein [Opitutus sp.]|nr:DUF1800 family protein [Opitutus sp.]
MKSLRLLCLGLTSVTGLLAQTPSVSNLSTRAQVGTGGDIIITGFNIGSGTNKTILIRATGPALAGFGVTGTLVDPKLELFNSSSVKITENDNWGTPVGNATPVTAATFSSVGAFGLTTGSRDAALLATLPPGSYTAQVSGVGNTTGVSLIEVYEVGAVSARLSNISTRALVGTGGNILIPGLVISPGSGTRRLLVRAAGPALGALGVGGALLDPTMLVLNAANGATVASNDNWGTPVGAGASTAAALTTAFNQNGAFAFATGSRDSALIADVAPGNYTIQVSGVGSTVGVALVEVYDITPVGPATVTLRATKSEANETGSLAGEFTITRAGDTFQPLTVNYGIGGSATNGLDYPALLGTVTIPAGATTVTIPLQPLADTSLESTETVTLTLAAGTGYVLGTETTGTVTIADAPGSLFVATLRPAGNATASAASGLATIVLSASGTVATVNVSFSNLSSGEIGAHLFLGNSTSTGDYVLNLPIGQVNGVQWDILPTATFTSAQILDALRSGLIYVGIDSVNYSAGEVRGAFLTGVGSQTFTAPATAPAVSLTNTTAIDAARLLTQATFGPKQSEITALTGGSITSWIDTQLALPNTSHRTATVNERETALANSEFDPTNNPYLLLFRQRAWFQIALTAPDQLRQRVAFALSQILVVSDSGFGNNMTEPLAAYYDILANNAFGNYRALLGQVTLSPTMGLYLSSLRNSKADPVTGTNPDENYAREVMQLFSIGLVQLQPDGTLKLDSAGLPIPTYNQNTISQMARIFTGFGFFTTTPTGNIRNTRADYINPMTLYPASHETGTKDLTPVLSTVIPANLGGTEDLKRALDALAFHDNTSSFISRQLIQRLVTDNPSPAYVYRVAEVFRREKDNSAQLGLVVRAILTDYEARAAAVIDDPGYGKLKEPLLRYTGFLRNFSAASASGRNNQDNVQNSLFQAPLRAPSVFNFFEPGYVFPGDLARAGLVAPEFQITDDTTAISVPNFLRTAIFVAAVGANAAKTLVPNYTAELALVSNTPALLDRLNLLMAGGQMSAATRARITTTLNALPVATAAQQLERVQTAVLLVLTSPDGSSQR